VTRAFAAIALVVTVVLASCGGGDSKTKTTPAAGAPGKSGRRAATPKRKRSNLEKSVLGPKPGSPAPTGNRKAAYSKAKAACQARGRRGIARDYGLRTRNATLVARLYSKKAFAPASQGAGFAGCVAGFR
jgi:hypothetical protein